MSAVRYLDRALLDALAEAARASPRRRRNHNFHPDDDFPAHRLLNAIEPDSYLPPHRHLDPAKDESIVVLRGRLAVFIFDEAGALAECRLLAPGDACCGVDIPHGVWHTVMALESGTVIFEAKAGPYRPLMSAELAPWAPAEGDAAAAAYWSALAGRLASLSADSSSVSASPDIGRPSR